ncbi:unnamed protein product [Cutaneotrichosporon oleaginosum]
MLLKPRGAAANHNQGEGREAARVKVHQQRKLGQRALGSWEAWGAGAMVMTEFAITRMLETGAGCGRARKMSIVIGTSRDEVGPAAPRSGTPGNGYQPSSALSHH